MTSEFTCQRCQLLCSVWWDSKLVRVHIKTRSPNERRSRDTSRTQVGIFHARSFNCSSMTSHWYNRKKYCQALSYMMYANLTFLLSNVTVVPKIDET